MVLVQLLVACLLHLLPPVLNLLKNEKGVCEYLVSFALFLPILFLGSNNNKKKQELRI